MELTFIQNLNIFLQLAVAALLGGIIGIERSVAHKTAGMRTYALVSMSAALFIVISNTVTSRYIGITNFDPLRVASQVIVGIGFIGAGLIIFKRSKLRGLTTAAGLWMAAGIGMAVGYELYAIAVFVSALTIFIFTIMWAIEDKVKKNIKLDKNK
ncbi:MAG: MgtC/SapB family protein [Parcubacteria group bacterium]|nr:MgtC/SapB family protein [Parcubacteria group bacterium]MCR4342965.1 MgtC/SapB family protein [Patescibacteria group bacterium]